MSGQRSEVIRIAASMTIACALGAGILGGVYIATERYAEAAQIETERRAVRELLSLRDGADILEVRQFVDPIRKEVVYRSGRPGATDLAFAFDGTPVERGLTSEENLQPLGRLFVATENGAPAGFVTEGEARGYKNRIRFFVALGSDFQIAGVRVLEHEEDPGLGAEVATPWFQAQYEGRAAESMRTLDVTRDPMPEDWRGALMARRGADRKAWLTRFGALAERESARRIYAATGATISSRALTDGVRATVEHFRRRWEIVGPRLLGGAP